MLCRLALALQIKALHPFFETEPVAFIFFSLLFPFAVGKMKEFEVLLPFEKGKYK